MFKNKCRYCSGSTSGIPSQLQTCQWSHRFPECGAGPGVNTTDPGATARQPEETWYANKRGVMSLLILMCVDLLSCTSEPQGKHTSTLTQNIPKYTDISPCVDIYWVAFVSKWQISHQENPTDSSFRASALQSHTQIRSWYIKRKSPSFWADTL